MFKDSNTFVSSSFPKHAKYKSSGVDWLGEVPEHWDFNKGKWLFAYQQNQVADGDEIITCFRDGEVTLRRNRRIVGFTNALQEIGYQHIDKGDLVIHGMDAFAGAIGVSDATGKATPVYVVVKAAKRRISLAFSAYLLRSLAKVDFILSLASGIRQRSSDFRWSNLKELQILTPPLSEQIQIVNFLDSKTAEIEEAIKQKQRTIELLEEYKHSLIEQAVTKGLDPSAPMKDSGVDWLGEVPHDWRLEKLKYVFQLKKEVKNHKLAPGAISFGEVKIKGYDSIPEERRLTYQEVLKGEFLVNPLNLNYDLKSLRIAKSNIDVVVSPGYFVLQVLSGFNPEYYRFLLRVFDVQKMKTLGAGVRQTISYRDIANEVLLVPQLPTQEKIANFLDSKTAEIEEAKSNIQVQIDHLKEYKDSLIESAVTGKIKVA